MFTFNRSIPRLALLGLCFAGSALSLCPANAQYFDCLEQSRPTYSFPNNSGGVNAVNDSGQAVGDWGVHSLSFLAQNVQEKRAAADKFSSKKRMWEGQATAWKRRRNRSRKLRQG